MQLVDIAENADLKGDTSMHLVKHYLFLYKGRNNQCLSFKDISLPLCKAKQNPRILEEFNRKNIPVNNCLTLNEPQGKELKK